MCLIICDNKTNKEFHKGFLREWGNILPAYVTNAVSGCIVYLHRGLVIPVVLLVCHIIYHPLQLAKVSVEVPGGYGCLVKIIADRPWDLVLIKAMIFTAGLLEGGVAIRKDMLTCITCRLLVVPWHWWSFQFQFW